MKKYLLAVMICVVAASVVNGQATASKVSGPVITWEKNTHDFGDITQSEKVEQTFAFTNTGNEPLIITNIQVTCGCTAPKWSRDPIAPGAKSEITIAFNPAGKMGKQNKVITVVSNATNDDNKITFTANVVEKKVTQ